MKRKFHPPSALGSTPAETTDLAKPTEVLKRPFSLPASIKSAPAPPFNEVPKATTTTKKPRAKKAAKPKPAPPPKPESGKIQAPKKPARNMKGVPTRNLLKGGSNDAMVQHQEAAVAVLPRAQTPANNTVNNLMPKVNLKPALVRPKPAIIPSSQQPVQQQQNVVGKKKVTRFSLPDLDQKKTGHHQDEVKGPSANTIDGTFPLLPHAILLPEIPVARPKSIPCSLPPMMNRATAIPLNHPSLGSLAAKVQELEEALWPAEYIIPNQHRLLVLRDLLPRLFPGAHPDRAQAALTAALDLAPSTEEEEALRKRKEPVSQTDSEDNHHYDKVYKKDENHVQPTAAAIQNTDKPLAPPTVDPLMWQQPVPAPVLHSARKPPRYEPPKPLNEGIYPPSTLLHRDKAAKPMEPLTMPAKVPTPAPAPAEQLPMTACIQPGKVKLGSGVQQEVWVSTPYQGMKESECEVRRQLVEGLTMPLSFLKQLALG